MVKAIYEEPHRGYALSLFCGCGIDPRNGRIVEVFVNVGREHQGDTPDYRDAMMERTMTDVARLVSFHLQAGMFPQALAAKLDVERPPGEASACVTFPIARPDPVDGEAELKWITSPIGAVVLACVVAQEDWRDKTAQLAREGVVAHA
jgi:hypothetical protein